MSRIQTVSRASINSFAFLRQYLVTGQDGDLLIKELRKITKELNKSVYIDPMRDTFSDLDKSLDLIEDVFGKDTVRVLINLNNVTKQTAKSWLKTRSVQLINQRKIRVLAVFCYYQRYYLKKSNQEIIDWYQSEDHDFNSTIEAIFNQAPKHRYIIDQKIRDLSEEIGIKHVF